MPVTNYYTIDNKIVGEKATGGSRTDYLTDALGSVTATIDQGSNIVNTYHYKPYGAQLSRTGAGSDPSFQWVGSRGYRQTGKKYSDVYVRARHYGSAIAAWSTLDRMRMLNRHVYVRGNPMYFVDPSGDQGVITRPISPPEEFPPDVRDGRLGPYDPYDPGVGIGDPATGYPVDTATPWWLQQLRRYAMLQPIPTCGRLTVYKRDPKDCTSWPSPCEWAVATGLVGPTTSQGQIKFVHGSIICCKGVAYRCTWPGTTAPSQEPGFSPGVPYTNGPIKLWRLCVEHHEQFHLDYGTFICSNDGKPDGNTIEHECDALYAQLMCLLAGSRIACNGYSGKIKAQCVKALRSSAMDICKVMKTAMEEPCPQNCDLPIRFLFGP